MSPSAARSAQGATVTGIGCRCAAGADLASCMATLFGQRVLPAPPRRFTTGLATVFPVFELPRGTEVDPLYGRVELSFTAQLALAAVREALADAGLTASCLRSKRVGVIVGTTVGSAMNDEPFYRRFRAGEQPGMEPIDRFLRSNPAEAIAEAWRLSGPCQAVVNACSSGTDAIGLAKEWIDAGICDVVLAGGADELCRVTYLGFASLMIASAEPCRPFDANRKGLNLGEGAAMLVLESRQSVAERGAAIKGRVVAYASRCDAHHITAPHPDGAGLRQALKEALAQAGAEQEEIAFVNAHGTATLDNDRVEALVLGQELPHTPYLSTKGVTGHTLGAAGAIEAAFTLGCLRQGRCPENIGFETADHGVGHSPATRPFATSSRVAISQSLAFGGNNSVLVLSAGRESDDVRGAVSPKGDAATPNPAGGSVTPAEPSPFGIMGG